MAARRPREVPDPVTSAELFELGGVRVPRLDVGSGQPFRDIDLATFAGLGIDELHFAERRRVAVASRRDVDREHVVAERSKDFQTPVDSLGVQEVGEDYRQPLEAGPRGELLDRSSQIRRAGRLHLLEKLEHLENPSLAAAWRRLSAQARAERQDRQSIEMCETDVAERRREPARHVELRRFCHRAAGVDHQVDRKVPLLVEQPQQQPVEALVGLPVDVAEIVAGGIRPMVGEFQPPASRWRESIGPVLPGECTLRDHVQILQLSEEVVFESKGATHLCPERRAGSARPRATAIDVNAGVKKHGGA